MWTGPTPLTAALGKPRQARVAWPGWPGGPGSAASPTARACSSSKVPTPGGTGDWALRTAPELERHGRTIDGPASGHREVSPSVLPRSWTRSFFWVGPDVRAKNQSVPGSPDSVSVTPSSNTVADVRTDEPFSPPDPPLRWLTRVLDDTSVRPHSRSTAHRAAPLLS